MNNREMGHLVCGGGGSRDELKLLLETTWQVTFLTMFLLFSSVVPPHAVENAGASPRASPKL